MNRQMINNLEVNTLFINKFKTISFAIVFFSEYTQKNIVLNRILGQILSTTSRNYPTKKEFSNRVYELYHTYFSMFSRNYDETLMSVLLVTMVNPTLIQEENYFDDVKEFFWQSILQPNRIDGSFSQKDFNEEKKLMLTSIENMYNNKESYAYHRLIEEMAPNEIINIKPYGTKEVLNEISLSELTDYYHYLFTDCNCKGYAIGEFTDEMVNSFFAFCSFSTKNTDMKLYAHPTFLPKEIHYIEEKQDVKQGKLVLGYRTNIHYFHQYYFPMVLFDLMLTGMTTSSLFKVVREQYGLAYSIHSTVQYDAKILTIQAGIEEENKDKTVNIIQKIIQDYQNNVDEKLLQMAKDTLISYYTETNDDCQSLLLFQIRTDLIKKMNIDEIIAAVNTVNTQQIKEVAKMIFLDTIYFLYGDKNE